MGVWSNIKANVKDIYQGTKAVVTGTPTSPYIRKQERLSEEVAKMNSTPPPTQDPGTSYTPYVPSGGGSSGGGGVLAQQEIQ